MIKFYEYVKKRSLDKRLFDTLGPYKIFIVNASSIRSTSQADDEFNHFATHLEFPKLVPENEIWISQDISDRERFFLIHNGINQYEGKKKKVTDWYDYALKKEKAEREKVDGIKFDKAVKPPKKLYYKKYCTINSPGDNIDVWLINGEVVRDLFKTDFIEGGNGEVYKWCPSQEIWVEKNLKEKGEIDITILHEYVESTLMKLKKYTYDKAHTIAAKVDWHHRGKFSLQDVKALNRKKALEMTKQYI